MDILKEAKEVLDIEIEAIDRAKLLLGDSFSQAAELIYNCQGKVILSGIGKSGIIARKIAGTMSSTGTLAIFLHPTEGLHGDLGIVIKSDIVIMLSKSGHTKELLEILPALKRIGVNTIGLIGNIDSPLAKQVDITIDASVQREACPLNLAPTASTTVSVALGDALATVVLKMKGFRSEDFAIFHPGGSLGKRLLLRVDDLMHKDSENPVVYEDDLMKDVLVTMTAKSMGAVNVIDKNGRLTGIITDGDLRRKLQDYSNLLDLPAREIMTKQPITITKDTMAIDALELMENRKSQIMVLPVIDNNGKAIGIVRLHDLVKAGL